MLEFSLASRNPTVPRRTDLDTDFRISGAVVADTEHDNDRGEPSSSGQTRGLAKWQIFAVDRYIAKNIHRRIGTAEIANVAGFSVNYFCRAFRASSGKSPQEHIKELRVEQAKAYLTSSSQSLADVADQCGFADQAHFTRVFKSVTGDAPMRWRGRHVALTIASTQDEGFSK
jgi:AraC family transcriptional regulator